MKDAESIVEQLKQRVLAERRACRGERVRFSEALKAEVVEFMVGNDWGVARVSRAVGVAEASLHRWLGPRKNRSRRGRQPSGLVEVEIVAEATSKDTVRIVFPAGAVAVISVGLLRDLLEGKQ